MQLQSCNRVAIKKKILQIYGVFKLSAYFYQTKLLHVEVSMWVLAAEGQCLCDIFFQNPYSVITFQKFLFNMMILLLTHSLKDLSKKLVKLFSLNSLLFSQHCDQWQSGMIMLVPTMKCDCDRWYCGFNCLSYTH